MKHRTGHQISSWKFIPTNHSRIRFIERVLPALHEKRQVKLDEQIRRFCRTMYLASQEQASAVRKGRRRHFDKPTVYLWHDNTSIVAVVKPIMFQTRVDCTIVTFLDMDVRVLPARKRMGE